MPSKDQFIVTPLTVVPQGSKFDVICLIQTPEEATKEHFTVAGLEDLKSQLRAKVEAQSGDAQGFKEISAVCNQPLDLSLPVPADPDEREQFGLDVARLKHRRDLISDGLLPTDDATTAVLAASLTKSLGDHPEWAD